MSWCYGDPKRIHEKCVPDVICEPNSFNETDSPVVTCEIEKLSIARAVIFSDYLSGDCVERICCLCKEMLLSLAFSNIIMHPCGVRPLQNASPSTWVTVYREARTSWKASQPTEMQTFTIAWFKCKKL